MNASKEIKRNPKRRKSVMLSSKMTLESFIIDRLIYREDEENTVFNFDAM